MRRANHFIVATTIICFIGACSEALPRERPENEVGDALIRAEKAAADASRQAAAAKAQAEANAKLLAEARALVAQSEAARSECADHYRRITDAEKARELARRKAFAKRKMVEQPTEPALPAATPTPAPQAKDPEYSPSDAPVDDVSK